MGTPHENNAIIANVLDSKFSATTAAVVRSALVAMLPLYPGQDLLTLALRTLTSLAINTRVDIPDQVSLLSNYVASKN